MYLLDSNAWIAVFRRKSVPLLEELKRHPSDEICLCSIAALDRFDTPRTTIRRARKNNEQLVHELRTTYVSLPLDDTCAIDAAELRAYLAVLGQPIGPHDLLIAAIARTHHLTLVTNNTKEFSRVPGLTVEDWQSPRTPQASP